MPVAHPYGACFLCGKSATLASDSQVPLKWDARCFEHEGFARCPDVYSAYGGVRCKLQAGHSGAHMNGSVGWLPPSAVAVECPVAVPYDERRFLRHLVDVVWQTAKEDNSVPATEWADRMIAKARETLP